MDDDLERVFTTLAADVPAPWHLAGVVYQGTQNRCRWIAFLAHDDTGSPGGPEGCGATAIEALHDLRTHLPGLRETTSP